eukprot:s4105_g4.t2
MHAAASDRCQLLVRSEARSMTKDDDEAEEEKAATQPVVPSIPIPIPGAEPAIGPQVNSLRPSSARYSFARDKKKDAWSGEGTPGPGYYSMDYANALVCASAASMGTAAARSHCSETRRSLKKEKSDPNTHLHVMEAWVTSTAAGPSPRIGFGTETREAQVSDLELLRACPESRYGSGPGLVYNPDYRIPGTGECVQNRLAEALLATSLAAWPAAWEERLDKWHRLRISTTIRRDVHVATASDVMFTDLLNEG